MPQPTPQETLARGVMLDSRYRIERLIGSGGYASVYKAIDTNYNFERAIKEVTDPDKGVREQFRLEADLLINHSHANIPRGYKVFEVGKRIYFVMDFVSGKDLEELLNESLTQQRRPLDEARVLRWAIEICDALSFIHLLPTPIIHRDIKPANIKITPDDHPVLIDFGLAKLQQESMKATQAAAQGVSPGFAPPEQYMAKGRTDARTDVYGMGATLYACLTGRDPAEAPARLLDQTGVSHGNSLVRPRSINARISPRTEEIIIKALELSPSKRQQSAADLEAELREALSLLTAATAASAGATQVMPQSAAPRPASPPQVDPASGKRPAVAPAAPAPKPPIVATTLQPGQPAAPAAPGTNKHPAMQVAAPDPRASKQPVTPGASMTSAATANHVAASAALSETAQHRTLTAAQPGAMNRSSGKHPVASAASPQQAGAQPLVGVTGSARPVLQLKSAMAPSPAAPVVASVAGAGAAMAVAEKEQRTGKAARVSAKSPAVAAPAPAAPVAAPARDKRAWIHLGTTPLAPFGKWMLALAAIEALWGAVALSLGIFSAINHGLPTALLPRLGLGWLVIVTIISLLGGQALSRPVYRRGALTSLRRGLQGTGLFIFTLLVHGVAIWGASIFIAAPGNQLLAILAYSIFGLNVLVVGALSVYNILD